MSISDEVRQFTVAADDEGIRLDRWFKRHLPQIGFATVGKWARTGQIRVDGKRAKPDDRLETGQIIRVPPGGEATGRPQRQRRALSDDDVSLAKDMVVLETKAALILNKPPGLATQGGTKTTRHVDGLLDAYAGEDDPRPRLVHRLDKHTSGILLIARTPGVGVPDIREGTIDAPLAKQPGSGGEKMHVDHEGGQPAKTRYRVVEAAGKKAAWLELEPMTGRTHQLRVHCAAMGHPIVGDGKYGGQDAFLTGSVSRKMHLHARRLIIDEPEGGTVDATADLPEHFASSMDQLGFNLSLSDAAPLREDTVPKSREEKKQAARQHAKQYRKARRGERKTRVTSKPGKAAKKAGGKTGGKPGGKPAARPSAKAGAKPRPKR